MNNGWKDTLVSSAFLTLIGMGPLVAKMPEKIEDWWALIWGTTFIFAGFVLQHRRQSPKDGDRKVTWTEEERQQRLQQPKD